MRMFVFPRCAALFWILSFCFVRVVFSFVFTNVFVMVIFFFYTVDVTNELHARLNKLICSNSLREPFATFFEHTHVNQLECLLRNQNSLIDEKIV